VATRGKLIAVCASARPGTKKSPSGRGALVAGHGLAGDAHAGSQRQVSLLAQESIAKMQAQGLSVGPGDFAENLTTAGVSLHTLPVGARLSVGGEALLEITQIGKRCHTDCEIKRLTGRCIMPTEGVFARVIVGGEVREGDDVEILGPSHESGGIDHK
jgi:MOSC domain-containing protein YiiM